MANNFFSRFPVIDYNIDDLGSTINITNFIRNVNIDRLFVNNSSYYTYYDIVDGERPDIISYKLYENANYHWTFFALNNNLRNGLNDAWPLSSKQFNEMMTREYDRYSVITFLPHNTTSVTGIGDSGIIQMCYFNEEYLPYLRIENESRTEFAKILKYDNQLLQLIIYDIKKLDGTPTSSIISFLDNTKFSLTWENPYAIDTNEYDICETLKLKFTNDMMKLYSEFDTSVIVDESRFDGLSSQEAIEEAIAAFNNDYVFEKTYVPAKRQLCWSSYINAASEYYETNEDDVNLSVSAFDVISSNEIILPKYISYFEKEYAINSNKGKIRVIRKDNIIEFVNKYFSALND